MDHKDLANETIGGARGGVGADGDGSADAVGSARNPAHNGVIPFHLIGQLQSNKIGKILPFVNTIEWKSTNPAKRRNPADRPATPSTSRSASATWVAWNCAV